MAVQRVDDDFLASFAKARVPRCRLVKQRAAIDVAVDGRLGRATRNIGNAHGTNIASLASTILEPLPNVQEELHTVSRRRTERCTHGVQ